MRETKFDKIKRFRHNFFESGLDFKFNSTGNNAVVLHKETGYMKKPYQCKMSKAVFYKQILIILDISKKKLEEEIATPIFREENILYTYYYHKPARYVDYLTDNDISVVFDDELLVLGMKESKLSWYLRFQLYSSTPDSIFWGFYKDYYLFYQWKKDKKYERLKPQLVEGVSREKIIQAISEQRRDYKYALDQRERKNTNLEPIETELRDLDELQE